MNWVLTCDLGNSLNCAARVCGCECVSSSFHYFFVCLHATKHVCAGLCCVGRALHVCVCNVVLLMCLCAHQRKLIYSGSIITLSPSLAHPPTLSLPLWWQHCLLECAASCLSAHCVPINKALCATRLSLPHHPPRLSVGVSRVKLSALKQHACMREQWPSADKKRVGRWKDGDGGLVFRIQPY